MNYLKKTLSVALIGLLSFSLIACGPAAGGGEGGDADAVSAPTGDDMQPKTTELTYNAEGEEQKVPATLFYREHFSFYLADEGWKHSFNQKDGFETDTWTFEENDLISFHVTIFPDQDEAVATEYMMKEHPDAAMEENEDGWFTGLDMKAMTQTGYRIVSFGEKLYGFHFNIPLEAAEGAGKIIQAMGDSFECV